MRDMANSADAVGISLVEPARGFFDFTQPTGVFHFWCVNPDGDIEFEGYTHNSLTDEGRNEIRNYLYRLNSPSLYTAGPYIGLSTGAVGAGMTLAGALAECTGGNYARVAPTWVAGGTGQANNTASAASWTASGSAITGAATLFITHAASGTGTTPNNKLISYATLTGGPYTVNANSTLNVTYTWTQNA